MKLGVSSLGKAGVTRLATQSARPVHSFPGAAVSKRHPSRGWYLSFPSFGGWKFKIRKLSELVPIGGAGEKPPHGYLLASGGGRKSLSFLGLRAHPPHLCLCLRVGVSVFCVSSSVSYTRTLSLDVTLPPPQPNPGLFHLDYKPITPAKTLFPNEVTSEFWVDMNFCPTECPGHTPPLLTQDLWGVSRALVLFQGCPGDSQEAAKAEKLRPQDMEGPSQEPLSRSPRVKRAGIAEHPPPQRGRLVPSLAGTPGT